jgi:LuxR family maltose regulon positive regulatory protein
MKCTAGDLVLTKLRPPLAHTRVVRRARLLHSLSLDAGIDLVFICAPAGYGKTTLLVDWAALLRSFGTAIAWYSLDESDNRPVVFGAYLVASLDMALGGNSGLEPVRQVLRASADLDLLTVLPAVINAVLSAGKEVVLVLDDYHLIRSVAVHRAVEFLIYHRPENLHLVIGSRANPVLPLARLRAQGRLVELRTADLRFRADETEQFLRGCLQRDIPADFPDRLTEQVEGWAVGLQLSVLSLAKQPGSPDLLFMLTSQDRHLGEYLMEDVINRLPEDLQSFLLYTALFDRFSAPLCNAILPANDSANQIMRLEQANLFVVALDESRVWFRYHHLLRDFLRAWFERTQPDRAKELRRAASGWFAGQGLLREAADNAFRCGDWAFAADFVEQHSFTLIIQSEIATIYEWCASFPEGVLRRRPRLCIFQALALAYRFQGKNRERVNIRLHHAEQALKSLAEPGLAVEAGELAAVVRTFLAMIPDPDNDFHSMRQLADAGLMAHPSDDLGRFPWLLIDGYVALWMGRCDDAADAFLQALPLALDTGLYFGYIEASFHLAWLAQSRGRQDEALALCSQAKTTLTAILQREGIELPALGCLDVAVGSVLLEQGHLDEAEQHLRQGLECMGWGMNPYYLMNAYLSLFRLNEIRGRLADAVAYLDQLDALWPDIHFLTEGCRLRAFDRQRPTNAEAARQAENWVQWYARARGTGFAARGLGPLGAAEAFYQADLIWLQMRMALNQSPADALDLEPQLRFARERGLAGREIEWLLVKAQSLDGAGGEAQALAVLESALEVGSRKGYVTVFCQNLALDDLIHRAAQRGYHLAGLDRLLSIIRVMRSEAAGCALHSMPPGQDGVALSEREREILAIIACGASNQEIAARLVITVGTVKGHINHILGKLGAANRTEAVAVARKLGMLD